MPNTYTQLYVHIVFAVKYRRAILDTGWDERLRKYITGIIQHDGHKLLAINNMPDHIHIFIGLDPSKSISHLMQLVKTNSSAWINKEIKPAHKFSWQTGYGAFSYAKSQIDNVVKYIQNQQEHHRKVDFQKEYRAILDNFAVDYDEKYLFTEME